ncbi:hypothetical protein CR164_05830 [Prosthecochloris marina]|uniref:Uncharacterized protein n=1 Tax=Prosthecochloris marina TaxID=2017681 RepID=A0A317TA91_9CHLB|nr:hypothetical protein CR164_05830 [Prosthecochloris marina]
MDDLEKEKKLYHVTWIEQLNTACRHVSYSSGYHNRMDLQPVMPDDGSVNRNHNIDSLTESPSFAYSQNH